MPYTTLPDRTASLARRQQGSQHVTDVYSEGRENPFFPGHSTAQEDNIDRSYLSEGLEYPEQSLHANKPSPGTRLRYVHR